MAAPVPHARVTQTRFGPVTHVRIAGAVDETFSPAALGDELPGHVVLDLGQLTRISSFGVRQWIAATRVLPKGAIDLYIINASPVIVDQLCMVEGFAGVARVLSLLAPYECRRCGEERMRLVDLRIDAAAIAAGQAPPHTCPVCGDALHFSDVPEQFFAHARVNPVDHVAPAVQKYLLSLRPAASTVHSNLKVVQDDLTFVRIAGLIDSNLNIRRIAGGLQGRVAYDLGFVSGMSPDGPAHFSELLRTAAESAQVFLWRVPPAVLEALPLLRLPPKVGVATLSLPRSCIRCGQHTTQRVVAHGFFDRPPAERSIGQPCEICGGSTRLPTLDAQEAVIRRLAVKNAPFAEFEEIEPRALSHSLAAIEASEGTGRPAKAAANDDGKLQVLRRIGHGGMAEVFLARQVGLKGFEKYVVMKKVLPQFANSPEFVEMLFAEARSSARLTHPNIVQIYDVGEHQGAPYITMEYVRGPDLRRVIALHGNAGQAFPVEHSLRIVSEIASGLHYAHSYVDPTGRPHPVIHRDVSPHNILISLDAGIKLSDFGIAKVAGESENTQPGAVKGKIAYVPPEAVKGDRVDGRGDLFSLGVVLYKLLTGKTPFWREHEVATLHAIMSEPCPDPLQFNPTLDRQVVQLLLTMLEKRPEDRYQTGAELRRAIEELMEMKGMRSSPDAVAATVLEMLGEMVGEFTMAAPQGAEPPPANAPPRPQTTMLPPPPPGDGSGSVQVMFEDNIPGEVEDSTRTSSPSLPPALLNPPPNTQTAGPSILRPPRSGLTPAPSIVRPPRGGHTPAPSIVRPPHSGYTPAPSVVQPPPSQNTPSGQLPWRTGTSSPSLPEVKLPPAPVPSAPRAPVGPPSSPGMPAVRPPRRLAPVVAAGALAAVAVVAVGYWAIGLDGPITVMNLAPDERVYVRGLRVDSKNIPASKKGDVLVSIAKDGILRRFGWVGRTRTVDAESLPEQHANPKDRGNLWVSSDPKGCAVIIDGAHAAETTPLSIDIKAGEEMLVEVMCPGLPRKTQWVLAAPGQEVQVSIRMFDEEPR